MIDLIAQHLVSVMLVECQACGRKSWDVVRRDGTSIVTGQDLREEYQALCDDCYRDLAA